MNLIFVCLKQIDPKLYNVISEYDLNPTPLFATSWLLTLFAHEVENFSVLTRIWDYLLTSNPLKIIHFSTALIIEQK